jgi:hypothetical protein
MRIETMERQDIMKTPEKEEKNISEKDRDVGGYGAAQKDGIICPPARHYDFLLEGVGDIFSHMPFSNVNVNRQRTSGQRDRE